VRWITFSASVRTAFSSSLISVVLIFLSFFLVFGGAELVGLSFSVGLEAGAGKEDENPPLLRSLAALP
jgi:hypothetical protein